MTFGVGTDKTRLSPRTPLRRLTAATAAFALLLAAFTAASAVNAAPAAAAAIGISGHVLEDVAGDATPGNGINKTTVRLWQDTNADGVLDAGDSQVSTTLTDASGAYALQAVDGQTYFVTVDAPTQNAAGNTGLLGEQTYAGGLNATAIGSAGAVRAFCDRDLDPATADTLTASGPCYGGIDASMSDAGGTIATTKHITAVTTPASGDVSGVDFGFSFNVVTNINDAGQGTVRQFAINANIYAGANHMRFVPAVKPNTSAGGASWWTSTLTSYTDYASQSVFRIQAQPTAVTFDGTAYSATAPTQVRDTVPGTMADPSTPVGNDGHTVGSIPRPELELRFSPNVPIPTVLGSNTIIRSESSPQSASSLTVKGLSMTSDTTDPHVNTVQYVTTTSGAVSVTGNAFGARPDGTAAVSTISTAVVLNTSPVAGDREVSGNYMTKANVGTELRPTNPTTAVQYRSANNYITGTGTGIFAEADHWTVEDNFVMGSGIGLHTGIGSGANIVANNTATGNGANIELENDANELTHNVATGATGTYGVGVAASAQGNLISQGTFGGNKANAIDLNTNGVSINANGCAATGTAGSQNDLARPEITSASYAAGVLSVAGTLCDNASTYTVELYKAVAGSGDGTPAAGEGVQYLGKVTGVTAATFATTITTADVASGDSVSAVVIRETTGGVGTLNDTSEFGPDVEIKTLEPALTIEKTSDATADTRPGDTVTYTVTAKNTGDADFTAATPAVLLDDLTGVLDDADYNADASADQPGAMSFDTPILSWKGALAQGASVELTYTVTLKGGGDGTVRNVAWQPADPENPETPACNPPNADGQDPTTGEPCAAAEFLLPQLSITKKADVTDLPTDGGVVTYTITVKNEGPGDYTAAKPATMTDDLSDVLDDAALDAGSVSASVGAATFVSPNLSWSGVLAKGASATITYQVTYDADAASGNHHLNNTACVPENQAADGSADCDTVQIPAAGLHQWKTVSADSDPVVAGTQLTYTLHFANDGVAAATVNAVDDLAGVVDDATVAADSVDAETGLAADLNTAGDQIAITGSVDPEKELTVTYTATVKADGSRGDDVATNFLLKPGDTPPTTCAPVDADRPDCTSTPIAAVTYSKSVSASTDPVGSGTVLTYTVTIKNTGATTANVSKVDDLSGVLDDATWKDQPVSDTGSVTVTPVSDGAFTMGGTLVKGATAKVVYSVTVNDEAHRGDNSAANFLITPGDTPPAECAADSDQCTVTPLPNIVSSKSVDPESGSTVTAGDELTYTLTFKNTGEASGTVDYTDLLAGVLDDATLVGGPTVSADTLTAALWGTDTIAVGGELAKGDTQTVKYTVKVKPDGQRADNDLGNFLVKTGTQPPATCEAGDDNCTENPVSQIRAWKEVSADKTPVAAGTKLTYTLHFENIGQGTGQVSYIDDLSQVLDDADVTTEPVSDVLTAVRDGDQTAITGELGAGKSATVSYVVTVKADGARGDDIASNFLLENDDPENPPEPPTDPTCQPTDAQFPACTTTPIGKLISFKSVSASSDPVATGTVLTYTLTFDNQGQADVAVNSADDLTDVLDDATIKDQPKTSDDALTASAIGDGDQFTVTGTLGKGKTVTVTYSVTVNDEAHRGNNSAANFLVKPGDTPPAECAAGSDQCTVTPLPDLSVRKSVDPATRTAVKAGQDLTYTLTFSNDGEAAADVAYTDDMTRVLDDAHVTEQPKPSDDALSINDVGPGVFQVNGSLAKHQTVTVTYTVTVNPDGERGDDDLVNFLAKSGNAPTGGGECAAGDPLCTENPTGDLVDWKTVNPESGSSVRPGTVLTYTLHFQNVGEAGVDVDRVDDLTGVLDDGDVTGDPASSDAALTAGTVTDGKFSIKGSLAPDQEVTVTFEVTVKADGDRGDDSLANFLLDPGQNPPAECVPEGTEPPSDAKAAADAGHSDCTVNPVSDVVVTKSADPKSGTKVKDGQTVTYTLTFENVSKNPKSDPAKVAYTDHLAGVLDDADLVTQPKASDDTLKVSKVAKKAFTVTGSVVSGKTVTVTYSAKVKAYASQGDHVLGNFVTVTGQTPPTVCVSGSALCTENPTTKPPVVQPPHVPGHPAAAPPSHGALPFTGASVTGLLILAFLLLGGGAALILVRRRRVGSGQM